MDYELAKQLKDVGFPQKYGEVGRFIYPDGHREMILTDEDAQVQDAAYIPTLSELIEACRNDFYQLEKTPVTNWRAEGTIDGLTYFERNGLNPEEAVANLWLELNNLNK